MQPGRPFDSTTPDACESQSHVLHFLGETIQPLWRTTEPFEERAGQCVFLCHKDKDASFWGIQVACHRPTAGRYVIKSSFSELFIDGRKTYREREITYRKHSHKEMSHECDCSVFQRLQQVCFQSRKKWIALIPCYGITDLKEITVCSTNHVLIPRLTSCIAVQFHRAKDT